MSQKNNDDSHTHIVNAIEIKNIKKWQESVNTKLDQIQNRQFFEMTVIFMSIAVILISHFT